MHAFIKLTIISRVQSKLFPFLFLCNGTIISCTFGLIPGSVFLYNRRSLVDKKLTFSTDTCFLDTRNATNAAWTFVRVSRDLVSGHWVWPPLSYLWALSSTKLSTRVGRGQSAKIFVMWSSIPHSYAFHPRSCHFPCPKCSFYNSECTVGGGASQSILERQKNHFVSRWRQSEAEGGENQETDERFHGVVGAREETVSEALPFGQECRYQPDAGWVLHAS